MTFEWQFSFELPEKTPAGQYLLRIDQIWPGVSESGTQIEPQLYPACAQIEVESATTGELPKGIKIPEGLSNISPGMEDSYHPELDVLEAHKYSGMVVSSDQYYSRKVDTGYVYPGGPLWDGTMLLEDKAPSS